MLPHAMTLTRTSIEAWQEKPSTARTAILSFRAPDRNNRTNNSASLGPRDALLSTPYNEECFEIRRKQSERKRAGRMVNELQKLGYFVVVPD